MGGRYFETPLPSHSQCVTPTHQVGGTVSSFWILGKVSEGCAWNNCKEASGDKRARESLVVVSGVGECDRFPWRRRLARRAETRPRSVPRPEEGVRPQSPTRTRACFAQHRARERTHARARHTRAHTGVSPPPRFTQTG